MQCHMKRPLRVPSLSLRSARRAAGVAALLLTGTAALAAGNDGYGVFMQGGHNIANGTQTKNVFIGAMIPWESARPSWFGLSRSLYWDAYIGQWHGPQGNGVDKSYTQLGALAVARFRFDEGASPWFADTGLGLAYLDDTYTKPGGRVFGSRLNFALRFGVGYSFGERDAHELSVNYAHFSNAGIKKPNPGEDFIQLRYAYRF